MLAFQLCNTFAEQESQHQQGWTQVDLKSHWDCSQPVLQWEQGGIRAGCRAEHSLSVHQVSRQAGSHEDRNLVFHAQLVLPGWQNMLLCATGKWWLITSGSSCCCAQVVSLCRFPVVAMGVLKWVDWTVSEPRYFQLQTDHTPVHLALLDEVRVSVKLCWRARTVLILV